MTPEAKLDALFAADRPPARDYVFEAEVARRLALRRAFLTVVALIPWAISGTVLLWAAVRVFGPAIEAAAQALAPTGFAAVMSVTGVYAALWASRRFSAG